jgi:hypothetical protein
MSKVLQTCDGNDDLALNFDDHIFKLFVAGAKNREPDVAKDLLRLIQLRLSEGKALPMCAAQWLGDALLQASSDPRKAAAALGLVATRKRPQSKEKPQRDKFLVIAVLAYRRLGHSLSSSASDEGAFALAAKLFNVSDSTVKRAWKAKSKLQPWSLTRKYYPVQ